MQQKVADGIEEARVLLNAGWLVKNNWIERRHIEQRLDGQTVCLPDDVPVFLLEKDGEPEAE